MASSEAQAKSIFLDLLQTNINLVYINFYAQEHSKLQSTSNWLATHFSNFWAKASGNHEQRELSICMSPELTQQKIDIIKAVTDTITHLSLERAVAHTAEKIAHRQHCNISSDLQLLDAEDYAQAEQNDTPFLLEVPPIDTLSSQQYYCRLRVSPDEFLKKYILDQIELAIKENRDISAEGSEGDTKLLLDRLKAYVTDLYDNFRKIDTQTKVSRLCVLNLVKNHENPSILFLYHALSYLQLVHYRAQLGPRTAINELTQEKIKLVIGAATKAITLLNSRDYNNPEAYAECAEIINLILKGIQTDNTKLVNAHKFSLSTGSHITVGFFNATVQAGASRGKLREIMETAQKENAQYLSRENDRVAEPLPLL